MRRSASPSALTLGNRPMARQRLLRALDHRHVDHLAVDRDRAAALGGRDLVAFRATIQRSRRLGFLGAACIHPSQVAILNEEYAPQAGDVAHAERVVTAYENATAQGVGAITVDGKMIDVPVVERAQALLARHRAIRGREAKRPR